MTGAVPDGKTDAAGNETQTSTTKGFGNNVHFKHGQKNAVAVNATVVVIV